MLLIDKDGSRYVIPHLASIHPAEQKDARDPTKVTAVHTTVFSAGGNQHSTSILWAEATKAFDDFYSRPAAAAAAAPPPPPAP